MSERGIGTWRSIGLPSGFETSGDENLSFTNFEQLPKGWRITSRLRDLTVVRKHVHRHALTQTLMNPFSSDLHQHVVIRHVHLSIVMGVSGELLSCQLSLGH
jgi:hypothetical protein